VLQRPLGPNMKAQPAETKPLEAQSAEAQPAELAPPTGGLRGLLDHISRLEAENKSLKLAPDPEAPEFFFQTLFFIQEPGLFREPSDSNQTVYLEEPSWSIGPKGEIGLKAHFPITDIEDYLRKRPDMSFIVAKFLLDRPPERGGSDGSSEEIPPSPP